jgi:antitoxin (DNA-binding transcriptional repressor) of toxin-antitoxin stability system
MEDNAMPTVTLEEAQTKLSELIDKLVPGEEVVITRNEQPVAELIRLPAEKLHPVPGRCKGMLTILCEDNEHLKDWAEYMP